MTSEAGSERERLAYQQGRRDSDINAQLSSHEARLNAINGSIEKHARNAGALQRSVEDVADTLGEKIDAIVSRLDKREAVEADRAEQVQAANQKQISTKQFWLGVATIGVMIAAAFITHIH